MKVSLRGRGLGVAAAVTAVSMALITATSAQAVVPTWKVGGYHPNCDSVIATSDGSHTAYVFYDTTKPKFVGFTAPKVIKVANTPVTANFGTVHVTDACSGVNQIVAYLEWNGNVVTAASATVAPSDGNYFDVKKNLYLPAFPPSAVGKWTRPAMLAVDRFNDFELNYNFKTLLGSDARTGGVEFLGTTDAYRNLVTYVVRNTTMGAVTNHTTVGKSGSVAISGSLKVANGAAYVGLGSSRVYLQRKFVGKSWTTVGDGLTSASGYVALSNKPGKTAYYRLVYKGKYSSPWNASVVTGAVKVTVK